MPTYRQIDFIFNLLSGKNTGDIARALIEAQLGEYASEVDYNDMAAQLGEAKENGELAPVVRDILTHQFDRRDASQLIDALKN